MGDQEIGKLVIKLAADLSDQAAISIRLSKVTGEKTFPIFELAPNVVRIAADFNPYVSVKGDVAIVGPGGSELYAF
jgi:hypothetical protein